MSNEPVRLTSFDIALTKHELCRNAIRSAVVAYAQNFPIKSMQFVEGPDGCAVVFNPGEQPKMWTMEQVFAFTRIILAKGALPGDLPVGWSDEETVVTAMRGLAVGLQRPTTDERDLSQFERNMFQDPNKLLDIVLTLQREDLTSIATAECVQRCTESLAAEVEEGALLAWPDIQRLIANMITDEQRIGLQQMCRCPINLEAVARGLVRQLNPKDDRVAQCELITKWIAFYGETTQFRLALGAIIAGGGIASS
jgi:hypothetical protein